MHRHLRYSSGKTEGPTSTTALPLLRPADHLPLRPLPGPVPPALSISKLLVAYPHCSSACTPEPLEPVLSEGPTINFQNPTLILSHLYLKPFNGYFSGRYSHAQPRQDRTATLPHWPPPCGRSRGRKAHKAENTCHPAPRRRSAPTLLCEPRSQLPVSQTHLGRPAPRSCAAATRLRRCPRPLSSSSLPTTLYLANTCAPCKLRLKRHFLKKAFTISTLHRRLDIQ